jgi:hypothetical protein
VWRDFGKVGYRLVGQEREYEPGQHQELSRRDDFGGLEVSRKAVQLFPRGQKQHRRNRGPGTQGGSASVTGPT